MLLLFAPTGRARAAAPVTPCALCTPCLQLRWLDRPAVRPGARAHAVHASPLAEAQARRARRAEQNVGGRARRRCARGGCAAPR